MELQKERMFSNKMLVRLLIPLVIEQALSVLVGMADGVMVSSVGEAAISGVSLVDMINNVVLTLFAGLATGGAVITSQFLGARDKENARLSAAQVVTMACLAGLGFMALCLGLRGEHHALPVRFHRCRGHGKGPGVLPHYRHVLPLHCRL